MYNESVIDDLMFNSAQYYPVNIDAIDYMEVSANYIVIICNSCSNNTGLLQVYTYN